MARSTIPAPEVTYGETMVVGTVEGRSDYRRKVQAVTIGRYTFAKGVKSGRIYELCGRCDHYSGRLPHFGHVYAGICFECGGSGLHGKAFDSVDAAVTIVHRRMKDQARRDRKAAAEAEARKAQWAAWKAEHPDVVAEFAAVDPTVGLERGDMSGDAWYGEYRGAWATLADRIGGVAAEIVERTLNEWATGPVGLSDRQIEVTRDAIRKAADRDAAQAAKVAASRYGGEVGEKVTVTGTVAVAKWIETRYGSSKLVIVEGTGADAGITAKTFGTGRALSAVQRGDTVTVTATVKDHDTYDGVPQTVLARTTVAEHVPQED